MHTDVCSRMYIRTTWELDPPNPRADDSAASGVPCVGKGLPQEARVLALTVPLLCVWSGVEARTSLDLSLSVLKTGLVHILDRVLCAQMPHSACSQACAFFLVLSTYRKRRRLYPENLNTQPFLKNHTVWPQGGPRPHAAAVGPC